MATERFIERNQRFRTCQTQRLQLFMDDAQQMLVVLRVNLDEHVVLPRRIMAFHHFRYLEQFRQDVFELTRIFQKDAQEGAGLVTDFVGIEYEFRTLDDAQIV